MKFTSSLGATLAMLVLAACAPPTQHAEATSAPIKDMGAWTQYLAEAARAEEIADPVERCRAYPDLPGNAWPKDSARARCGLLVPGRPTIDEITRILAAPDGAQALDRQYRALLDAHIAQPAPPEGIYSAFNAFVGSEQGANAAELWHARAPGSPFAATALGMVRLSVASERRGTEWVSKTPASQIEAMQRLLDQGVPLLQAALVSEPRLGPACTALMFAGRLGDGALWNDASRHCRKVDPLSWNMRHEWQRGLDPRWGGSIEALARSVEEIRVRVPDNPVLGSMLSRAVGSAAYLPTVTDGGSLQAASAGLDEASRLAPDPLYIGEAGKAALAAGQFPKAIGYLSQAIRLAPDAARFIGQRADARTRSGDVDGAIVDARRAIALDASDGWYHGVLAHALLRAGHTEQARESFQTAMQFPERRQWAFKQWCETYIAKTLDRDAAANCTEGLISEYPQDRRAVFMRAWVLYATGDDRADDVAARFRQLSHQNDPGDRQMLLDLADARREALREAKEHPAVQ